MLETLVPQPEDKILKLMGMFKADDRPNKIDLGVGVYKDASGVTPIMGAVKAAEQQLWGAETTKSYTGLAGDPGFSTAMRELVLGDAVASDRVAAAATPGGTGAVRQAFELIQMGNPEATIWTSRPTWPNHLSMLKHLGAKTREYAYFDTETCAVEFDAMMADLGAVAPGDVVLLHGCCHNPTGANLNAAQWRAVADHLVAKGAIPMIDIAYQGFGDGLEEDASATRLLAQTCPEMIIAASCSKNFGIYRERTGLLMAISPSAGATGVAQGTLSHLNRQNFSFPPDHGARLVTMILNDDTLRGQWQDELEAMRTGMLTLRKQLSDELRARTGSDRFGFIAEHRGMFSRIGVTPEQVDQLREKHAVYAVGDSRINIAGMNAETVPVLAEAVAEVIKG
ncbi:Aspartate aminotransferase [Candidatus Rhodobacter oscarellae]|uniref:Aspartate aminotransferase n=1 Tax=Candidatus Rhodobacter oscarellae TaxID=1675527 RepID=A0A0J9ECD2_9RHOB|nr:amino acid aminotransferase [Candidatus Rhodobacter lobularis]KMW60415.1 Aspartate aminotransferase [Candidatus Rhodobacter lobularis]